MRRRKRKYVLPKNLLLFLVLLFFGMGVGYAAFSGNVSVSGSMAFREARWSVHFDDETLETLNGSVNANSPNVTDTHITFNAVLENPGDFYEFTIDVINDGTFNALIEDFEVYPNLSSSQADYFEYTVTYSDGAPIQVGDALNVNQSETIRVRFRYKTLSNENLYPMISQSFNFSIGLHYIQGNGNERIVHDPFVFSPVAGNGSYYIDSSVGTVTLNQALPANAKMYTNSDAVRSDSGQDCYIRTDVENNAVTNIYMGLVWKGVTYEWPVGLSHYSDNIDSVDDVDSLMCFDYINSYNYPEGYLCWSDEGIIVMFLDNGDVDVLPDNNYSCKYTESNQQAYCYTD